MEENFLKSIQKELESTYRKIICMCIGFLYNGEIREFQLIEYRQIDKNKVWCDIKYPYRGKIVEEVLVLDTDKIEITFRGKVGED